MSTSLNILLYLHNSRFMGVVYVLSEGIGNEGGADRVLRNTSKDGLAASVTFRSIGCPFLNNVKVRSFPAILCSAI